MRWTKEKLNRIEVFFEFLIFGVIIGIVEDVIAVKLTTGHPITWKVVGIIFFVTIPFAIVGELIVDRVDFVGKVHRKLQENKKNKDYTPHS